MKKIYSKPVLVKKGNLLKWKHYLLPKQLLFFKISISKIFKKIIKKLLIVVGDDDLLLLFFRQTFISAVRNFIKNSIDFVL